MDNNVLQALILTAAAGLSTGVGGLIGVFAKKTNTSFLTFSLGLSAGVMVYISFVEMMPHALTMMAKTYGGHRAELYRLLAFLAGMALIAIIDKMIPEEDNPHEACNWQVGEQCAGQNLKRAGILTALAVGIHNFPEGIATFVSAIQDPKVALPIVVAIAIHNIPEGIAVSAPIFYATGKRGKAFLMSLLSGMAEPIGALLGWLILMPFLSDAMYGFLYALVAGIMVFISFDELLPSAEQYGKHHIAIAGVLCGMVIMAVSLVLFM